MSRAPVRSRLRPIATHLSALSLQLLAQQANASSTGSITEWETPLQKFQASITGPVAFYIAAIAIAITGGMLAFGGELSEFTRKMIMVILVIAVLVEAVNILSTLFGIGALVG